MVTVPSRHISSQDAGDDYAFFQSVLDEIDASELLQRLAEYRWTGRQGYSPESMWRAVLLRYLLNVRYTRDLIVRLRTSERLRTLCGFGLDVPSESTFSRFFRRLLAHQDLVDDVLRQVVDLTGARLKGFGRLVAVDSTDVEAYGEYHKEKRCADPDAKWGRRTSKDPQVKDQLFYGYKLHLACDANHGVPLAYMVLPANANDSPQLPKLFDQIAREDPELKVRYAIADRGYDGSPNYRYLHRRKIGAVIAIRDMGDDETYSLQGRPRCIGGQDMDFVKTDRKKGHLFRCPEGGCDLKDVVQFTRHCDTEYYEKPRTGEELRKIGQFARANPRWQPLYDKRGSVERLFGSAKQSRLLDTHLYLGIQKVRMHIVLSLLAYTGTMLAHALEGDVRNVRRMSVYETLAAAA